MGKNKKQQQQQHRNSKSKRAADQTLSQSARANANGNASSSSSSPWPFLVALVAVIVPLVSFVHLYPTYFSFSSFWSSSSTTSISNSQDGANDNNSDNSINDQPQCTLVMAPSTLPGAGWGMFTLTDRPRGVPLYRGGDPAVPVVDLKPSHADHMRLLLHDYLWQGHVVVSDSSAMVYEGQYVYAALPGTGMLANSLVHPDSNVAPPATVGVISINIFNGAATHRTPHAGAVSEYRNFSFYTVRNIPAGAEILVDYGRTYFDGHSDRMSTGGGGSQRNNHQLRQRSVAELRQIGYCLDNLKASEDGYRAVAALSMDKGAVVAPVPVLPLRRSALLQLSRPQPQQLLLNYCYGHAESSLLLFPYAPTVHLVNHCHHHQTANVALRWAPAPQLNRNDWLNKTVDEILAQSRSGLVLELVATQPIEEGDELRLDYGPAYQEAWDRHVAQWTFQGAATPSYQLVDKNNNGYFRTIAEQQKLDPYPGNIFTSCLYRHEGNSNNARQRQQPKTTTKNGVANTVTFQWSPHGVGPEHARPCRILERHGNNGSSKNNNYSYTVAVGDRPHMPAPEQIAEQQMVVVVTGVPAAAIRFADRTYTTDPHLPNAFRHEIRLPDDVFPDAWKDLLQRPHAQTKAASTTAGSSSAAATQTDTTRDASTTTTTEQ